MTQETSGSASGPDPVRRLEDQRAIAIRRLESLVRERDEIVASTALVATDDEHDPEGATIAFEREQLSALLAAAQTEIATLDAALQRVANGTYGRCERCGGPIAAGRLSVRPGTTTCIDCARRR